MVCARTHRDYKVMEDKSSSKERTHLAFMILFLSSALWLPSWEPAQRGTFTEPTSFLFTISILPQIEKLSISKVKLTTVPWRPLSCSTLSFGFFFPEDRKYNTV